MGRTNMPAILVLIGGLLTVTACSAADRAIIADEKDKVNYSVGYQIGNDFKEQGIGLNAEALARGARDAMEGGEPLLARPEMHDLLVEMKNKVVARDMENRKKSAEKYRGEGREFLAANAKKEGVVVLASGLQYKVLREGTGRRPILDDTVTVNYRGTRLDGQEFNSTYRKGAPVTIPLATVIPGWKEAIPLMKEGAKWQLFVPADLAFGERGPLADRTVIFEIELISIKSDEEKPK